MPKPKIGLAVIFCLLALASLSLAATNEESITITTYYPSPYGVYNEMRAKKMAVGDNYYSSDYCWSPNTCQNQIASDVSLVVEGRIGIGTTNPNSRANLHLYGFEPLLVFENKFGSTDNKVWGIRAEHTSPSPFIDELLIGPMSDDFSSMGSSIIIRRDNWHTRWIDFSRGVNIGRRAGSHEAAALSIDDSEPAMSTLQLINGRGFIERNYFLDVSSCLGNKLVFGYVEAPDTSELDLCAGEGALMVLQSDGRVGIGTTNPQSTLQVASGHIQFPFVTVAPASTECDAAAEAGRVVVFTNTVAAGDAQLYVCDWDGTSGAWTVK